MKRFLLIFCALCATVALWADVMPWIYPAQMAKTEIVDGIEWMYRISDGKAIIGNGRTRSPAIPVSTSGSITIPSTLGGYPVTVIGESAFYGCKNLTSVTIPSTITSVEAVAFFDCYGLKEVHVSDIAVWCGIEFTAFYANPLYYAKQLYVNGEWVTDLVIPKGVTSIGGYAFANYSALTTVKIPASVRSIGECVFAGCSKLMVIVDKANPHYLSSRNGALFTKDLGTLLHGPTGVAPCTLPSNIRAIGGGAFYNRKDLISITIPPTVTSIGKSAFHGCSGLTSVTIPPSVKSINAWAFLHCSRLKEVRISDLAAWCAIDISMSQSNPLYCAREFYVNDELVTDLVIPDGVTSIGQSAFYGYKGLRSVKIPSSVTSIGNYAFGKCTGLPRDENGVQYESEEKRLLIEVPKSLTGEFVIPDTVRYIHSGAFIGCRKLTSVRFPPSVTFIADYVFRSCPSLKEVHISDIAAWCAIDFGSDSNPLYRAEKLYLNDELVTDLIIPKGVTAIKHSAFINCRELRSIKIPPTVTSIGAGAFYGCKKLFYTDTNDVQYESKDKLVLISAPRSLTGEFVVPNSVRFILSRAFSDCSRLTSIKIHPRVISIGSHPFSNCPKLKVIVDKGNPCYTAPRNGALFTKDAKTLLHGPTELASCNLPPNVKTIARGAFYKYKDLTSITIPASVTSIESVAFYSCPNLKSIAFLGPPPTVENDYATFYEATATATYLPEYAEQWAEVIVNGKWSGLKMEMAGTKATRNPSQRGRMPRSRR